MTIDGSATTFAAVSNTTSQNAIEHWTCATMGHSFQVQSTIGQSQYLFAFWENNHRSQ